MIPSNTVSGPARREAASPPSHYGAALRSRWPLVLVGSLLAGGIAYGVSVEVLPKVYRSSATVIVNQAQNEPAAGRTAIEPFTNDQSLSETFEQLALQPAVSDQVARDLSMKTSALVSATTVHAVPRTPLVIISVEGPNPEQAARRTQAYTAQFVQSTLGNAVLPGRAMVVSGATRPTEPIAPRPRLNALIASVAALLLGIGVLLARVLVGAGRPPAREGRARDWRVRDVDWHPPVEDTPGDVRIDEDGVSTSRAYDRRGGA